MPNYTPVPDTYETEPVAVETLQPGDAVELKPSTPVRVVQLNHDRHKDLYRVAYLSIYQQRSLVTPAWTEFLASGALVQKILFPEVTGA